MIWKNGKIAFLGTGVSEKDNAYTEKTRILVVCQHYWPEQFRVVDLCQGLVENGFEVDVLCGEPNYPKGEWFEGYGPFAKRREVHNGVRIFRAAEIRRKGNTNARIFLNYVSYPICASLRALGLLYRRYDKVFIYEISPVIMAWPGLLVACLKGIESIMYVLDLWPDNLYSVIDIEDSRLRKIALKISTYCYANVDKLICITDKMAETVAERIGKAKGQIYVLPQACEKIYERRVYDKELVNRFSDGFNVVFTGNISPAQDFPTIIRCAKEAQIARMKINWIIVGDGMARSEVESSIKENGLEDAFFFEGFVPMEDVPKYTGIADALIACLAKSAILDTALPAKVSSYMASGKPLLVGMDGEASRIVSQYQCGFAGPSGDWRTLFDNLCKLYGSSREERIQMGDAAMKCYIENYERESNYKRLVEIIKEKK